MKNDTRSDLTKAASAFLRNAVCVFVKGLAYTGATPEAIDEALREAIEQGRLEAANEIKQAVFEALSTDD